MATATWEITSMMLRAGRKPVDRFMHDELVDWGQSVGGRQVPNDWPTSTILGRLIEFGITGAGQPGITAPQGDPRIVAIERAVAGLPSRHRRAVVSFYAGRNAGNSTLCARECRCSIRVLQETLRHAREFLAEALYRKFA